MVAKSARRRGHLLVCHSDVAVSTKKSLPAYHEIFSESNHRYCLLKGLKGLSPIQRIIICMSFENVAVLQRVQQVSKLKLSI